MKRWEIQIHWEPSTIVSVEAETREEAEQLALEEAGQPSPMSVEVMGED